MGTNRQHKTLLLFDFLLKRSSKELNFFFLLFFCVEKWEIPLNFAVAMRNEFASFHFYVISHRKRVNKLIGCKKRATQFRWWWKSAEKGKKFFFFEKKSFEWNKKFLRFLSFLMFVEVGNLSMKLFLLGTICWVATHSVRWWKWEKHVNRWWVESKSRNGMRKKLQSMQCRVRWDVSLSWVLFF